MDTPLYLSSDHHVVYVTNDSNVVFCKWASKLTEMHSMYMKLSVDLYFIHF
jgi:hypothetical protein